MLKVKSLTILLYSDKSSNFSNVQCNRLTQDKLRPELNHRRIAMVIDRSKTRQRSSRILKNIEK